MCPSFSIDFATFKNGQDPMNVETNTQSILSDDEIETSVAVIATTGRFPNAQSIEAFTRNFQAGESAVREFTRHELLAAGVPAKEIDSPDYRRFMGWLDKIDQFDADLFGMIPKHAQIMDPQQRVFMECAWEVCERAGYAPRNMPGRVGVFAGARANSYLVRNISRHDDLIEELGWTQILLLNDSDHLPLRVAHALNLSGPAVAVGATCSTSLTAIHMACQSLLNFEADMMLAGGASIMVPDKEGYKWTQGSITSANGECRAFDSEATGTISGNGVAVVLLKRLADALSDGDQILSVVRGSAIGNDGADKAAYSAPAVSGQHAVLQSALADAEVDPATIGLIETHGTGTHVGDPIEFEALQRAYGAKGTPCHIGTLKPVTGHLSAAAGAAAFIKATASLQAKKIPPMVNFDTPNPELNTQTTRFEMSAKGQEWAAPADHPRRAGVSAFGLGGANAHIILQEAPEMRPVAAQAKEVVVLPLSARSLETLSQSCATLAEWMKTHQPETLTNVAYTLQLGREDFVHRLAVAATDWRDAAEAFSKLAEAPHADLAKACVGRDALQSAQLEQTVKWLDGQAIDWSSFHDGPRQRVLLPTMIFEHQSHWVASPTGACAPFLTAPNDILAQVQDYLAPHISPKTVADTEDLVSGIDGVATAYVLKALTDIGFVLNDGEEISLSKAISTHRVQPQYAHLFRRLMLMLTEDGLAKSTASDVWTLTVANSLSTNPEDLLDDLVADSPTRAAETEVFRKCGTCLAGLLTADISALDLLFPDGDLEQATKNYRDTERAKILNGLVAEAIKSAIADLPMGRRLSVLEIGAGTGATSHYVLPVLPEERTTYLFTDVSSHFLVNGQRAFADYDFVDYTTFDICRSAEEQGFVPQSFDIIIAANVLHVAPHLTAVLEQVETLLTPGGLLVMLEGTANSRFSDITFGTLESWDNFEDAEVRTSGAFTTTDVWTDLMQKAGFVSAQALPGAEHERGLFSSVSVLLAQADPSKSPAGLSSGNGGVRQSAIGTRPEQGAPRDQQNTAGQMIAIWKAVIGNHRLEPHQRFFEVGGDSLIATQILSRVRNEFKVELPVKYFFSNPSISDAADAVQTLLSGGEITVPDAGKAPSNTERTAADPVDEDTLLDSVEDLSDEDLESLLADLE